MQLLAQHPHHRVKLLFDPRISRIQLGLAAVNLHGTGKASASPNSLDSTFESARHTREDSTQQDARQKHLRPLTAGLDCGGPCLLTDPRGASLCDGASPPAGGGGGGSSHGASEAAIAGASLRSPARRCGTRLPSTSQSEERTEYLSVTYREEPVDSNARELDWS